MYNDEQIALQQILSDYCVQQDELKDKIVSINAFLCGDTNVFIGDILTTDLNHDTVKKILRIVEDELEEKLENVQKEIENITIELN